MKSARTFLVSKNQKTSQNQTHSEEDLNRFEDLKAAYPGCADFFDDNKDRIILAMCDVLSEIEMSDLYDNDEVFQTETAFYSLYPSSSVYATEDLVIDQLDFKRSIVRRSS